MWPTVGVGAVGQRAVEGTWQAEHRWIAMRLRNRLVLGAFVDNAGMSEREVARRAGLSHSTVNHLITGRRITCSLPTAAAIAQAVGCPIGALFIAETAAEQRTVGQGQMS